MQFYGISHEPVGSKRQFTQLEIELSDSGVTISSTVVKTKFIMLGAKKITTPIITFLTTSFAYFLASSSLPEVTILNKFTMPVIIIIAGTNIFKIKNPKPIKRNTFATFSFLQKLVKLGSQFPSLQMLLGLNSPFPFGSDVF